MEPLWLSLGDGKENNNSASGTMTLWYITWWAHTNKGGTIEHNGYGYLSPLHPKWLSLGGYTLPSELDIVLTNGRSNDIYHSHYRWYASGYADLAGEARYNERLSAGGVYYWPSPATRIGFMCEDDVGHGWAPNLLPPVLDNKKGRLSSEK